MDILKNIYIVLKQNKSSINTIFWNGGSTILCDHVPWKKLRRGQSSHGNCASIIFQNFLPHIELISFPIKPSLCKTRKANL